jgi:hypothetical protein
LVSLSEGRPKRAEKAPPRERGSGGQSFLDNGLAAGRSERHRQDDTGSSIGGATDETPSRAVGFCVGWPTRKSPASESGAKLVSIELAQGLPMRVESKPADSTPSRAVGFLLHTALDARKFAAERAGVADHVAQARN